MYKLIYLIPLFLISEASASQLKESGCESFYYEKGNPQIKTMFLPGFSMLNYNSKNEFHGLEVAEEITITAIRCERSSIVPNEYDYMAVKAGYPFFILSNERVLVIEIVNGQYRIRHLEGAEFSLEEKEKIGEKLNFFQSRSHNENDDI